MSAVVLAGSPNCPLVEAVAAHLAQHEAMLGTQDTNPRATEERSPTPLGARMMYSHL
ncbi:MAG TPA: hypothetical protein VGR22_06620 [Thermomicrobiales bacterium]|nr:hypothetical protein [Thermomicrobiales bacterium]